MGDGLMMMLAVEEEEEEVVVMVCGNRCMLTSPSGLFLAYCKLMQSW